MKVSDYIVRFLAEQGVECVFGYQGGMITHMVDSLSRSDEVRFISCYHEQHAAFAAEGYARMSGRFGVCLVTSGPGATNTLTSVANAYFDSVPVLYLMGQVNTYEYKYEKQIRQQGFQETDVVSMSRPVSKDSFRVEDGSDIERCLQRAVDTMMSGRKGPVVLELPMNVQRDQIEAHEPTHICQTKKQGALSHKDIEFLTAVLREANRPLVLCGGGIADAEIQLLTREFLRRANCPYVVSLLGKGLVDESADLCLGMIGSYGNRCANMALAKADVVLVLGSRLDLRQTGNRKSKLLTKIKFIRIDPDEHELIDGALPNQMAFRGDCRSLLEAEAFRRFRLDDNCQWCEYCRCLKSTYSQDADVARFVKNGLPYHIMQRIMQVAGPRDCFVADIGQNQMWAAQIIRPNGNQPFMTSGGMAPMGYAIPCAVGMSFADHTRHIYCICGDGGFHFSLQALLLISQYKLPITIVIMNNRALGMITQFQRLYFNSNMAGTTQSGGYCVPKFKPLANAYGLRYIRVTSVDEFPVACAGGELVEVVVDGPTSVVPKLEFNRELDDMTPSFEVNSENR